MRDWSPADRICTPVATERIFALTGGAGLIGPRRLVPAMPPTGRIPPAVDVVARHSARAWAG
jgi:hypothetical protein